MLRTDTDTGTGVKTTIAVPFCQGQNPISPDPCMA